MFKIIIFGQLSEVYQISQRFIALHFPLHWGAEAPVQSLQVGPAKGAKNAEVNPAHLVARLTGHAEEAVLLDVEEEAEANGGDLAVELLHHHQLIGRREDAEGLDALAEAAVLLHVVAGRIEAVNQRGRSVVVDDRQLGFIVKHLHGHAYLLQALGFVNVEIKVWWWWGGGGKRRGSGKVGVMMRMLKSFQRVF